MFAQTTDTLLLSCSIDGTPYLLSIFPSSVRTPPQTPLIWIQLLWFAVPRAAQMKEHAAFSGV